MRTRDFIWAAIVAIGLGLGMNVGAQTPVLEITGGQVRGVETATAGVDLYKGIPYAAPPVGDLRWKAPQPVVVKEFYQEGDPMRSEDCLYLNVWTPASGKTDAKLPVAFWIHGGAFMGGFGYEKEFDGEAFARRGVVLVTINYRLGLLGFMAHPALSKESEHGVSGNYGLLDQIAALDWVRENIAQFGGDPDNITIFGQSAGAMSVRCLLASPLTKGKIARAIIQSGGGLDGIDSDDTLADYEKIGEGVFGDVSAEELRSLTTQQIQEAYGNWMAKQKGFRLLSPMIDGYALTANLKNATRAGSIPSIPYMLGGTEDDMGIFKTGQSHYDFSLEIAKHDIRPAYIYHFARPLPGDDSGAFHSSELWYVFGTLQRAWRPFTAGDYDLSNLMLDYWTNFMKNGDPNGAGLERWEPYTTSTPYVRVFDVKH